MEYQHIRDRAIGVAYVLGPTLLVISASCLLLDIGRNPGAMSWGSSTEGVIGFYGFILLVPVFLSLADYLGHCKPKLAIVVSALALVGFAGGGVFNMTIRAVIPDLMAVGMTESMTDQLQARIESGQGTLIPLVLTGPLVPISSILLGIGLLLAGRIRARAWLLIAAGALFMMGQLLLVWTEFMYILALAMWAVALIPIGVSLLRGNHLQRILETPGPVETHAV